MSLPLLSPVFHPSYIMIGSIMLLIPGIAMTNSVRDMLTGDTISGTLRRGDEVICSYAEHNAVMRLLDRYVSRGEITVHMLAPNERGILSPASLRRVISRKTALVIIAHASNVTGLIQPIAQLGAVCRERGVPLLVDAAQTAGMADVSPDVLRADMVAMPGHKGLLGPQGTGLLVLGYGMNPEPLLLGGTGSMSESVRQPDMLPDRYESGTVNLPGIAGLYAGVKFVRAHRAEIEEYELALCDRLRARLREIPGVRILCDDGQAHMAITSIVVPGHDGGALADALDAADIAVRAGLHCAPAVHAWLGTLQSGAIRFSPGLYNTAQEMDDTALLLARLLQA